MNVMHLLRTLRLCRNAGRLFSNITRPHSGQCRKLSFQSYHYPWSKVPCSMHYHTSTSTQLQSHSQQCQFSRMLSNTRTPQVERDATFLSVPGLCPSSLCLSVIRQSSSKPTNIDKDVEVKGSADEIEWNHPASRTEDAFTKDPELHSLLCEIASDFGKSQTAPTDHETMVIDDGPSSDKRTPVEMENDDAKMEEGLVATTTEDEAQLERTSDLLKDAGDLPLMIPSRNARKTSVVFNIVDIVDTLREENAQDICVIAVPPEKNYVDYFIVVTGRSTRHLSAMTQGINKLYKERKGKSDPFLIVEGKFTDDWMCLDFGNIVAHFMLEETRALYGLEELWTMGKDFDDHIQRWEQHETLLFNPETDLQTRSEEGEESEEK